MKMFRSFLSKPSSSNKYFNLFHFRSFVMQHDRPVGAFGLLVMTSLDTSSLDVLQVLESQNKYKENVRLLRRVDLEVGYTAVLKDAVVLKDVLKDDVKVVVLKLLCCS